MHPRRVAVIVFLLDDLAHRLGIRAGWLCDWTERLIWTAFGDLSQGAGAYESEPGIHR